MKTMLIDKLKRLFSRNEIPTEARDLLRDAKAPRDLLRGLDELVTRNEMEVNTINRDIEALEEVECMETERVRCEGPDRCMDEIEYQAPDPLSSCASVFWLVILNRFHHRVR